MLFYRKPGGRNLVFPVPVLLYKEKDYGYYLLR